jgi:hypothetical protein
LRPNTTAHLDFFLTAFFLARLASIDHFL